MKNTFKILFISISIFFFGGALTKFTASAADLPINGKLVFSRDKEEYKQKDLGGKLVFSTDKKEYKRGESIRIMIKNNSNAPIWYINYPAELFLWDIEKFEDNAWVNGLYFSHPLNMGDVRECRVVVYEPPLGAVAELKANSVFTYEWGQDICPDVSNPQAGPLPPNLLGSGKYRFVFHYGLKTKKPIRPDPWERKEDLANETLLFSNEFLIGE